MSTARRKTSHASRSGSEPRLTIEEVLGGAGKELSAKQKILVSFLHRNYQKVAFASIIELARETNVSEATIVRLATQLGFDGYPSLQRAVRKIVSQELTTLQRMQLSLEADDLDHPCEAMFKMDVHNIMRLYHNLTRKDIDSAVSTILNAENVLVAGLMASAPLALYFGYSLTRVRRSVSWFTEDGISLKHALLELGPKDLLITFGFPRYPAAIVNMLRVTESRKVGRLVFTDTGASPLVAHCSACIFMPFEVLSFVDSLAAPMSFLAGLVSEIVKSAPAQIEDRLAEFELLTSSFGLFHRE